MVTAIVQGVLFEDSEVRPWVRRGATCSEIGKWMAGKIRRANGNGKLKPVHRCSVTTALKTLQLREQWDKERKRAKKRDAERRAVEKRRAAEAEALRIASNPMKGLVNSLERRACSILSTPFTDLRIERYVASRKGLGGAGSSRSALMLFFRSVEDKIGEDGSLPTYRASKKGTTFKHDPSARNLMVRAGLDPSFGRLSQKVTRAQAAQIARFVCSPLTDLDIAYFVGGVSALTVKKVLEEKGYRNRRTAPNIHQGDSACPLTFRLASEIFYLSDAGFTESEIADYMIAEKALAPEEVRFALCNRRGNGRVRGIEDEIKFQLEQAFQSEDFDGPYRLRTSPFETGEVGIF